MVSSLIQLIKNASLVLPQNHTSMANSAQIVPKNLIIISFQKNVSFAHRIAYSTRILRNANAKTDLSGMDLLAYNAIILNIGTIKT